jgi:nucleoside 2-deoxyribosyltransferase
MKVYCAGPLFNDAERSEMARIANVLERSGHEVFLPQRDGLEFAKIHPALNAQGLSAADAEQLLARAIFSLDVYKLLGWSEVVVANLNGRVSDEGTIVEAALAWHSGKVLVLYKADARAMLNGFDNPMLSGLGGFQTCSDMNALNDAISMSMETPAMGRVKEVLAQGEELARDWRSNPRTEAISDLLIRQFTSRR